MASVMAHEFGWDLARIGAERAALDELLRRAPPGIDKTCETCSCSATRPTTDRATSTTPCPRSAPCWAQRSASSSCPSPCTTAAAYAAKARERFAAEGIEVDALAAGAAGGPDAFGLRGGGLRRRRQHLPPAEALQDDRAARAAAAPRARRACPTSGPAPASTSPARPSRPRTTCRSCSRRRFDALGLVPFQINPHYLDADAGSRHMGETREDRIREFHEENDAPVVGLREGAWLRIEGADGQIGGAAAARVFRRGRAPEELAVGASLAPLLRGLTPSAPALLVPERLRPLPAHLHGHAVLAGGRELPARWRRPRPR